MANEMKLDLERNKVRVGNKITYDETHKIAYIHFNNDAEPTIVDYYVGKQLEGFNFQKHRVNEKDTYTAISFTQPNGKQKQVYLHRYLTDAPTGKEVDHFNNKPFDNRVCNLEVVTKSENLANRDRSKHLGAGEFVDKTIIDEVHVLVVRDGIFDEMILYYKNREDLLKDYRKLTQPKESLTQAISDILQEMKLECEDTLLDTEPTSNEYKNAIKKLQKYYAIMERKQELDEMRQKFQELGDVIGVTMFDKDGRAYHVTTAPDSYEPFEFRNHQD